MSILSQIGVVVLIVFIVLILVRSNKTLEEVEREGEYFVDEWDLRQQKKAERLLQKEEKKALERKQKLNREDGFDEDEPTDTWDDDFEYDEKYQREYDTKYDQKFRQDYDSEDNWTAERSDKIIPMKKFKNPGITLVQLGENHRPVHRVTVDCIPFTIGRSAKNHLVLDDLCVARMHCRIVEKDGRYFMEDVGTANKLFVNGRIQEQVELRNQLTIYIGNVEFQVEMGMQRSSSTQLYQHAKERYYE